MIDLPPDAFANAVGYTRSNTGKLFKNGAEHSVAKKLQVIERLNFLTNKMAKFRRLGSLPQRLMSAAALPKRSLTSCWCMETYWTQKSEKRGSNINQEQDFWSFLMSCCFWLDENKTHSALWWARRQLWCRLLVLWCRSWQSVIRSRTGLSSRVLSELRMLFLETNTGRQTSYIFWQLLHHQGFKENNQQSTLSLMLRMTQQYS